MSEKEKQELTPEEKLMWLVKHYCIQTYCGCVIATNYVYCANCGRRIEK